MTFSAGPMREREEKKLAAAAKDEDVSLFSSHPLETPKARVVKGGGSVTRAERFYFFFSRRTNDASLESLAT